MIPVRNIAMFLLAGILLAACAPDDRGELQGSLYFAAGEYLAALHLRDGSTSVVANLGDAELLSLGPAVDNRLLLNVIATENRRSMHKIVLFDVESRQQLTLLNGRFGHYLPGTRVLVFDDGVKTWVTEKIRGSWEKTEVVEHRYNGTVGVMPISPTRFMYAVGDGPLSLYDLTSGRSIPLQALESLCSIDRALWVAQREEVLCRSRHGDGSYQYVYAALDGSVSDTLPLPGDRDLRPVAWLSDQNVLILTERWQARVTNRWKWGVWVYRLDTGEFYRLLDDQHLGDTVVYSGSYHG